MARTSTDWLPPCDELGTFLRVEGHSDEEALSLSKLDGLTLSLPQISTWARRRAHLDVLIDMVNREGQRLR